MPEEALESERHQEWLWNLSVEEIRALQESDDPHVDKPFVREVPVDVAGRFRALQELLRSQEEFESRYPAAFEILFPRYARRRERVGLHLPSFGIRVLHNWVHPHVGTQYLGSGADAHTSVSAVGGRKIGACMKRTASLTDPGWTTCKARSWRCSSEKSITNWSAS
jgi:hypothetical protein